MEKKEETPETKNWSETVEDLINAGHTDAAISLLQTLISDLQPLNSPDSQSQFASALQHLSAIHSSNDLSIRADQLSSQASAVKLRILDSSDDSVRKDDSTVSNDDSLPCGVLSLISDEEIVTSEAQSSNVNAHQQESSDDDWEAMVDRPPEELLSVSSQSVELEVSKLSRNDGAKKKAPNRRGRGTFTYTQHGLYSDQQPDDDVSYESQDEEVLVKPETVSETRTSPYGTKHVLVLEGFHPRTATTDLEKLFDDFRDRGFSIRWVHDTLALAVFRTPSIAHEALNSIQCSFSVRVLEEDDSIAPSVSIKDLEPPRQRPKTSARTAQRLIAQELGVKLPSKFGSKELREQEDARKSRIATRHTLRDEAWGPGDT